MAELLELKGITKRFPGVLALDNVDFTLRRGEVHALMGENGAGKSTLIKVISGVHSQDQGTVGLDGNPIRPRSPEDAARMGISTVFQEVNLVPNLSVAENICLGRQQKGTFGIRWREVARRAEIALKRLGIEMDVRRPLGSCSVAIQQMTAIARALDVDARVLVLDEPTSSLDRDEVSELFSVVRRLRDEGLGIVFITHFLDQVYEIADRVTVLRNGCLVGERALNDLPKRDLVSMMIGRDASSLSAEGKHGGTAAHGEPLLVAENLGRKRAVTDISLELRSGEVVGLAGLLGSGRTETVRLFFGIDRPDRGKFSVGGRSPKNPRQAIAIGMGLCPEDRKHEGILPDLSVRENMMLVVQSRRGWWRRISKNEQRELVDRFVASLRIATSDSEKPIQFLSGGNQQKVLLARWLAANPKLLLLDEPTRGIDVGAKFEISALIEDLRAQGMAFVLVSSELEEVVRDSTRVAVLRDRKMVGMLDHPAEPEVMALIAGEAS